MGQLRPSQYRARGSSGVGRYLRTASSRTRSLPLHSCLAACTPPPLSHSLSLSPQITEHWSAKAG
eukprot:2772570-Rhodomonas_salina.2